MTPARPSRAIRPRANDTRPGYRFERLTQARVVEVTAVTPRVREIRLRGPGLVTRRVEPGAHLPLEVPREGAEPVIRTYSVWRSEAADSTLTLRLVLHDGGGPGMRWARSVAIGDRVRLGTPRNRIRLDPAARHHVFLGEESAAVPLLTMLAALPDTAPVRGVLETTGPDEEFEPPTGAHRLSWVHRGDAPAAGSPTLLRTLRGLDLPREPGTAYVAGEATACRAIVTHLVRDRAWPRKAIRVQTQWTPGRCGLL